VSTRSKQFLSLLLFLTLTLPITASPKIARVIRVSDGQITDIQKVAAVEATPTSSTKTVLKSNGKITVAVFGMEDLIIAPNPYNPNTDTLKIDFTLGQASTVEMWLYSINGQEQWHSTLAGSVGFNQVTCDAGPGLATGPYVLYLKAQNGSESAIKRAKLLVLK
jgi:hypothetical protein